MLVQSNNECPNCGVMGKGVGQGVDDRRRQQETAETVTETYLDELRRLIAVSHLLRHGGGIWTRCVCLEGKVDVNCDL